METFLTPPTGPVMPVPALAEYIVSTPGTCGGKPRLTGHRIRVQDIAILHEHFGYGVDEIVTVHYPQLTLAQVYAALAYYHDHREEIQDQIADDKRIEEEFRKRNPSKLQAPLDAPHVQDPLPPG